MQHRPATAVVLRLPLSLACAAALSCAASPDGGGGPPVPALGCAAFCDPVQGLSCDETLGICVGPCAGIGRSYVGCEYLPTITANVVATEFAFGLAVSNVSDVAADVQIEGGALAEPRRLRVEPGDVAVEELPWVDDLKVCVQGESFVCTDRPVSALVRRGAYRVRSTAPVIAYQFSPLDYTNDAGRFSYTNDASLLVPTTALSTEYIVPGWRAQPLTEAQGGGGTAATIAITAPHADTDVTILPTAPIEAGVGVSASPAGEPIHVHLGRGDVVQLLTLNGDFTGTRIEATAPVQVITAHLCANVPLDTPYCDHLEEIVFPRDTFGTEYAVVPPAVPGCDAAGAECATPTTARIVALSDGVVLEYDPPQLLPTRIDETGGAIDLVDVRAPFVVRASGRIMVEQLMHGQCSGLAADDPLCMEATRFGDPALAVEIPTGQYRESYLFHAPRSYASRFVTVTGPIGATVVLDGTPLRALAPIGASGLGYARVALPASGNGNHRIEADERVGLAVYGYGQFTSFWYPGGLDLEPIDLR